MTEHRLFYAAAIQARIGGRSTGAAVAQLVYTEISRKMTLLNCGTVKSGLVFKSGGLRMNLKAGQLHCSKAVQGQQV
jgi:hypothetical protein